MGLEEENTPVSIRGEDRFSRFMFGAPKNQPHKSVNDEINYMQIIEQVDHIVESVKELKPLLNMVTPVVKKYFPKK
ncbi:hypothetical protein CVD25_05910 [Bacillus canaveralius]|uniref:Uncharacterized protein n=1 Tax=Bacillus canaveralius TaxID=1403243 RepID=A0A2N5GKH2_9BACI|nr:MULTISPECIES: hypothetical protein [Bacillus]PLR82014.1 hypothetical protein CU635_12615 [Bacillus canaveralius]PLR83320.1 hypothetical protein CVD23_14740 [Bacillus sp. V33-4]PLR99400.1 hypothetical protein CVD25_05910 [Bacillus canaveralius]RSK56012.1 hypothetical protein EJA13_02820 [Bacillus canaveralius]